MALFIYLFAFVINDSHGNMLFNYYSWLEESQGQVIFNNHTKWYNTFIQVSLKYQYFTA